MAGYFKDKYLTDFKPVLLDWLSSNQRGQNVTDLALSLANRAQRNLWAKRPWCDLATDVDVVVDQNASYMFPEDFGRIVSIWADLDGTGAQSYWYFEGCDLEHGYKMRDQWDKSAGHAWVITFNYAQPSSVKMVYQRTLEDFTGGATAEYLFFPMNLMLLECQKIKTREKGLMKELPAVQEAFDSEFKDYCNCHQWVNFDTRARMNDRNGIELMLDSFSLDGSSGGGFSPRSNAYLG